LKNLSKKERVFYTLFIMAAIVVVMALYGHSRTFDDMVDIPADADITASYWIGANSYIGAEWEHGSPEAERVLQLLRGTTYSRSLIYEFLFRERRINRMLNGNSGMLTLVLQSETSGKYLIGFLNGTMSFDGNTGFTPENKELYTDLVEMVKEQAG
jgi:hypothetical protein